MYQKILVPIDLGDKHSWRKAIPTAVTLCEAFDAGLIVMTVIPDIGMPVVGQYLPQDFAVRVRQQISGQLKDFVQAQIPPGIEVQRRVAVGKIYREIIHTAAEAEVDLIVMGSHHPELKDYLLGPNAARVMRHATVSVMVVRD
ncbi:MAG: universal stress protein [Alphaproteobacteria bacterium]|nr:universal stress protein [Alphaproteobacteria bacterium]